MDEYKPNSDLSKKKQSTEEKPPEKRVTSTVSSPVVKRKQTAFEKFVNSFVTRDLNSIKDQIWKDIIWPRIRGTLMESLDMILPGTSDRTNGRYRGSNGGTYVDYTNSYKSDRDNRLYNNRTRVADNFRADDISFRTREQAEEALVQMDEIMDRYGMVRLADLYDYCNLNYPYTYQDYGWKEIGRVPILATSDGYYVLKMPNIIPLK